VDESYTAVQAFETKLYLFSKQLEENKFTHFPTLSLHHCVQNVSRAHPASYSMDTWGSFPEGKAAGE